MNKNLANQIIYVNLPHETIKRLFGYLDNYSAFAGTILFMCTFPCGLFWTCLVIFVNT